MKHHFKIHSWNIRVSLSTARSLRFYVTKIVTLLLVRGLAQTECVCLGSAVVCGFLTSCRKKFTAPVQMIMRIHLFQPGTVKQGRAQHGRSNRGAQTGLLCLIGKSEKRELWGQVQGISLGWLRSQLPIASQFRILVPVKKDVWEEGNGAVSFVMRLSSVSCRRESLGRSQGWVFSRVFISIPGVPFQSLQLVPVSPTWFCCFGGQGAEMQLKPRCYLQGGSVTCQVAKVAKTGPRARKVQLRAFIEAGPLQSGEVGLKGRHPHREGQKGFQGVQQTLGGG